MNKKYIIAFILGVILSIPIVSNAATWYSSVLKDTAGFIRPSELADYVKAEYFVATSTGVSSVFPSLTATTICISADCKTAWPTGGGGSGGGTWSTTTSTVSGQLVNYSNNTTDIPTIGSTSTTTAKFWFDPNTSIGFIRNNLGIGTTSPYAPLSVVGSGGVVAERYVATSTTVSNTFASKVGVATTSPTQKLEVSDGNLFISSASGQGRSITISTDVMDDSSRPSIKFPRNNFAVFQGDDHAAQIFGFVSGFTGTRVYGTSLRVYGPETAGFSNYTSITHDGFDGSITTATGDLVLAPTTGRVGQGTTTPRGKLEITGDTSVTTNSLVVAPTTSGNRTLWIDGTSLNARLTNQNTVNGVAHIFLQSDVGAGFVGIATTTATSTLDVYGSISTRVTTITATTTLDSSYSTVRVDTTSTSVGVNLPPVAGACGRHYFISKKNSGSLPLTIDGSGSETIAGSLTQTITSQHTSLHLQAACDDKSWLILN